MAPTHTVVQAQLHPSLEQLLAQAQGKRQRPVVIEQAAHLDPALGGLHQRLHQRIGTGTGLDQIKLQIHLLLSTNNGGEHAWEKRRAIDQKFEAVAFTPGKDRTGHLSVP
ncbi:hypothetical protein D9M71_96680 [compost metagenome]